MNPRGFQYFADVSSNNGPIDITNYSRAGHALIAIKATEGTTYVNPFHLAQSAEAHGLGLTVLHYHFLKNQNSQEQLDHFRNQYLKGWRNGDYVCFDSERSTDTPSLATTESIIIKCFSQTGHEAILYTGEARLNEELSGIKIPGERFWIANYSHEPKHKKWAWQYTDGSQGPDPHFYTGIGKSDGSILGFGPAAALNIRKIRTRKRK